MATYFGQNVETGSWTTYGSPAFYWRNHNLVWTCPGSGVQVAKELSGYFRSNGGTPGHIRLALYSLDGTTKICEGSAEVTVDNVSGSWVGHGSGLANALNPAAPEIVGGVNYRICFSLDAADVYFLYNDGGDGANYWNYSDYTSGFPTTIDVSSGSGTWNISIRCGVDPPSLLIGREGFPVGRRKMFYVV